MRFYEDSRFFLTLSNGNEESVLAKNPADFLLLLSTADEKCVFSTIVESFFESFSLHFTTEDLRAVWAKKRKTFFEKFSVPTIYWRLIPGLAENF